jgi:prepilin-type N-terminal cleavage/methylation domain-containing protein
MKTQKSSTSNKSGFTLMELMVAMAITTIIVTVLVSITSIALDTWNRSRSELRASRQAKSMVDTLARDLESLVTRRGNKNEWLTALTPSTLPGGNLKSANACELIFFTAATDRYEGQIGTPDDKGGDVSCVAYELGYKNPITANSSDFETFVLNRLLVNPDDTFQDLLGQENLDTAFNSYKSQLDEPKNFVCENIYQFTVTFHVQVAQTSGTTTTLVDVPITVGNSSSGQSSKEFRITGEGNVVTSAITGFTADELKSGRLTGVEIGITVLTDFGIDQLRNRSFTSTQQAEFLAKNSFQYTKLVQLPSM